MMGQKAWAAGVLERAFEGRGAEGEVRAAIGLALLALRKQIPQEPKVEYGAAFCPLCGTGVARPRFCPTCGQAMDWNEREKRKPAAEAELA